MTQGSPAHFYCYSPHQVDNVQPSIVPIGHTALPNGQTSVPSPSCNPHKRLKRSAMPSISCAEDSVETVAGDGDGIGYYKSTGMMTHHWQDEHDHGVCV